MTRLTLIPKKIVLDQLQLAALACDLAKRAKATKDVLHDYGLEEHDYYELEQNEFFKKALAAAVLDWNRPLNTKQRCELGALSYLEKLLPHVMKRALDEKQPLNACVDATRLIAKIGGVEGKEQSENDSDRVVITINLGADEKLKFDKQVKPIEPIDVTPKAVDGN